MTNDEIYEISGPLDLTVLMKVYGLPGFDALKAPGYTPVPVPALMNDDDILQISEKEISFNTSVRNI